MAVVDTQEAECPEPEMVIAYYLDFDVGAQTEQHIKGCPKCRKAIEKFRDEHITTPRV